MRNKRLVIFFSVLCSLTLVVVLSSVIFSVQHVYEICTNENSSIVIDGDITLKDAVLSNHKIRKGSSIFLADEDEMTRNLEKAVPRIKIVNIEKKFPNRVYINYEYLFEYFQLHSGGNFYILSNQCKITNITDVAYSHDSITRVIFSGDIGKPSAGDYLSSSRQGEVAVLSEILRSFVRLDQAYYNLTTMIDFIDLRNDHEIIYFKTTTGVYLRFLDWSNVDLKLQLALSWYSNEGRLAEERNTGTLTVDNNLRGSYSIHDYYAEVE